MTARPAALLALLLLAMVASSAAERAGDPDGEGGGGGAPFRRGTKSHQLRLSGRFFPGRTSSGVKLPQLMTWAGSSVTVRFAGSDEVSVGIDGRMSSVPAADRWVAQARSDAPSVVFQFELDGVVSTAQITKAAPMLTWNKTGLSTGPHTLTITRATEPRYGAAWLTDINIDAAGVFLPPPTLPGRRILFIGDSYTAGAGNTASKTCKNANAANSNTLLAYGPVAARALKAEYQVLGWSVATLNIYRKVDNDPWPPEVRRNFWPRVRDFWRRVDALDPASSFAMTSWVPQVVVMAAGTNDFANASLSADNKVVSGNSAKLPSMNDWVDAHEAFVREIAQTYPRAIIINLVFPLEQQLVGVRTLEQTLAYLQYFAASEARFRSARMTNVYTLQLDGSGFPNTDWCSNHPDEETHAMIADQLAAFVRRVAPGWAY